MSEVLLTKHAEQLLSDLKESDYRRVAKAVGRLSKNPVSSSALVDHTMPGNDLRTARAGDYRIVYGVGDAGQTVNIINIFKPQAEMHEGLGAKRSRLSSPFGNRSARIRHLYDKRVSVVVAALTTVLVVMALLTLTYIAVPVGPLKPNVALAVTTYPRGTTDFCVVSLSITGEAAARGITLEGPSPGRIGTVGVNGPLVQIVDEGTKERIHVVIGVVRPGEKAEVFWSGSQCPVKEQFVPRAIGKR